MASPCDTFSMTRPDDHARGQLLPRLTQDQQFGQLQHPPPGCRLPDDPRRPAAVLDRLDPPQDQLGVGLADGEGSH